MVWERSLVGAAHKLELKEKKIEKKWFELTLDAVALTQTSDQATNIYPS